MTIEIRCRDSWLEKGTPMYLAERVRREGRVSLGEVVFQLKPGEVGLIDGPDLGLRVKCNDRDDGGEVTISISKII